MAQAGGGRAGSWAWRWQVVQRSAHGVDYDGVVRQGDLDARVADRVGLDVLRAPGFALHPSDLLADDSETGLEDRARRTERERAVVIPVGHQANAGQFAVLLHTQVMLIRIWPFGSACATLPPP